MVTELCGVQFRKGNQTEWIEIWSEIRCMISTSNKCPALVCSQAIGRCKAP